MMFLLLWVFVASVAVIGSAVERPHYDLKDAEKLYEDYLKNYNKNYSSEEEKQQRFEIFKKTLQTLNERNAEGGAIFAIDHFADLTGEEISQYMGFKPIYGSDPCKEITDEDIKTNTAPKSLDWRAKGAVTAVKRQGACGSCYAFGCIGNIEGRYFLKTKQLLRLSEQEIVDCSPNYGCDGGYMSTALDFLKREGGVELESDYPYVADEQTCAFNSSKVAVKVTGCNKYNLKNEDKLRELLTTEGPLILGINGYNLQGYHGGILTKKDCESKHFGGHSVVLVGYGTSEDGVDYWIIKNSWGTRFGEQGYFRATRGDNTCQLLTYVGSADVQ